MRIVSKRISLRRLSQTSCFLESPTATKPLAQPTRVGPESFAAQDIAYGTHCNSSTTKKGRMMNKKLLALFAVALVATVTISMAGCTAPDEQTQAVIDSIDAIGEVSPESAQVIASARRNYNNLSDEQKGMVRNIELLEDSEAALDTSIANECIELIDSIGAVSLDSQSTIKTARDAYERLTEEQRALVSNLDRLESAEAEFSKARANEAEARISDIGTVTLESDAAVQEADSYLQTLTREEQELVKNKDILTAAKEQLKTLKDEAEVAKTRQALIDHGEWSYAVSTVSGVLNWDFGFNADGTYTERNMGRSFKFIGEYEVIPGLIEMTDSFGKKAYCPYTWENNNLSVDFGPIKRS